ncbi:DNA-binding transcriptional regulator, LysR family [Burkholderia sp. OK233]|nr:DNA-binding transcriptional regulator, LysR family [Burkholderia sp. OK233]
MDKLRSMSVFVRVADSGGFASAARGLQMSASAISKIVTELEEELGVRLFARTTRQVSLTEVGRTYYDHCARIVEDVHQADESVTQLTGEPRGLLRISAPMTFGNLHVVPALTAFMRAFPEIDVDLSLTDSFSDVIHEGFDVAVRIAEHRDSNLIARRICACAHAMCASPAYLEEFGDPSVLEDLVHHNCLGYSLTRTSMDWRVNIAGLAQSVPAQGRFKANNGDALLTMALEGTGIVLLPTFMTWRHLQAGSLVRILPGVRPRELDICALYPHARHLPKKVRAFVDFLADFIGPVPYWDRSTKDVEITYAKPL